MSRVSRLVPVLVAAMVTVALPLAVGGAPASAAGLGGLALTPSGIDTAFVAVSPGFVTDPGQPLQYSTVTLGPSPILADLTITWDATDFGIYVSFTLTSLTGQGQLSGTAWSASGPSPATGSVLSGDGAYAAFIGKPVTITYPYDTAPVACVTNLPVCGVLFGTLSIP